MSMADQVFTLHITMKSGTTITVDVEDATYKSSYGGSKTLEWTSLSDWQERILHLDMSEVAAVIVSKKAA